MPRVLGYLKEAVEGTTDITVNTTVTRFGNESEDRPHPWQNQELYPSFKEGQLLPGNYQRGMNKLDFDIATNFVHVGMFEKVCGKITDLGGNSAEIEFGEPNDLAPFSVYSQVDTDAVVCSGCKAAKLNLDIVLSEYIRQAVNIKGWKTENVSPITNTPPAAFPTGLINSDSKGFDQVSDKEFNDVDQANIREFHLEIMNVLDVHGGLGSRIPRGIEQVEGSVVKLGFLCTFDGTVDDLLSVLKEQESLGFEPGNENDFEYTLLFDNHLGAGTGTYTFQFHNVNLTEPQPITPRDKKAEYAIVGFAMDDGSNKPFSLITDDGVDYTLL